MNPFALDGGPIRSLPFFVIEDSALFRQTPSSLVQVDRAAWRTGSHTEPKRSVVHRNEGGEPLILYTSNAKQVASHLLAEKCFFDSEDQPEKSPYVFWNFRKDVTDSKGMHISTQPFLLRKYARRVAKLWQQEYGRWPGVSASTAVSMNFRPFQQIVDPGADLARVPAHWFLHNPWIRHLVHARIPGGAVTAPERVSGNDS
jgi:hypothetical protein